MIINTKDELMNWIKSAYAYSTNIEYDGYGNEWKTVIYGKDDSFFSLDFCNGSPIKVLGKDFYQLTAVKRVTKMIEVEEFEAI